MSNRDFFKFLCAVWGLTILLIFIPCDFLFRIDSTIKFMKPFDILVDLSIIIEAFALLIVFYAFFNTIVHSLIFKNGKPFILMTNISVAVAFIGFTFVNFGTKWVYKVNGSTTSDNIVNTEWGNILFIFFIAIGFINFKSILTKITSSTTRLLQTLGAICLISLIVICFRIIQTFYFPPNTEGLQSEHLSGPKPNVILITFDSLCSGDMSLYGYTHDTTPFINNLAHESFVFKNFYANSNWTRPSVASILTGSRPVTHGLNFSSSQNIYARNDRGDRNLPMFLRKNGYDTLATSGNLIYAHPWKNDTYQGFVRQPYAKSVDRLISPHDITSKLLIIRSSAGIWFNDTVMANVPFVPFIFLKQYTSNRRKLLEHQVGFMGEPAEFTFKQAEKLLTNCKKPFFLWVHIFPPHSPYLPPTRFRHTFLAEEVLETRASQKEPTADWHKLRLRYDEMILYADSTLEDFLENIKKMGMYDNTLLIVSSDHGESFEHGYKGHGGPYLYQQAVHIPLIIHLPGQKRGFLVKSNAEQVDIAPTIVALLGMRNPGWFEGESLTRAMYEGYDSQKPKYMMNLERSGIWGGRQASRSIGVIEGDYKYIFYPELNQSELYDLAKDQNETHDLVRTHQEKSRHLHSLIVREVLSKEK
ncbi:MAG: sulfatase [Desulfuromonadales bacterium]|nr:sulfatase [Desulfuromonadales bacterium]